MYIYNAGNKKTCRKRLQDNPQTNGHCSLLKRKYINDYTPQCPLLYGLKHIEIYRNEVFRLFCTFHIHSFRFREGTSGGQQVIMRADQDVTWQCCVFTLFSISVWIKSQVWYSKKPSYHDHSSPYVEFLTPFTPCSILMTHPSRTPNLWNITPLFHIENQSQTDISMKINSDHKVYTNHTNLQVIPLFNWT